MGENFFVSFNSADRNAAHWIAWMLRQAGHGVAVHDWELPAGGNIPLWMNEKLSWATRLIAVISPNYLPARYSPMEWASKLWEDPTGELGLVIPVVVQPTPHLPPLLAPLARIELFGCDEAEAERRLLDAIGERQGPSQRPDFPGFLGSRAEGGLQQIFRPPYRLRNRYFTGRERLLENLESRIGDHFAGISLCVLFGPMGVGKTALATEHAFRCRSRYRGVWTVNCETKPIAEASFALLADELRLARQDASLPEKVAAAHQYLNREGDDRRFLLIFDNVESPSDIANYANFTGAQSLATSRNPEWGGTAQVLEVKPLGSTDSLTFLQVRAGQTSDSAQQLADALGYLPLALEQAAAYCSECQLPLESYLREHEGRLLEDRAIAGAEYPSSLAASVLKSAGEAQRADSLAETILDALALLAPEPVPRELLYQIGAEHGAALSDVDRCLARLRRLALIKLTPDAATVHRAIRAVLRAHTETRRGNTAHRLLQALSETFPAEPFELADTWAMCGSLWPHVLAVRELNRAYFSEASHRLRYCSLINSAGGWLHATGQYEAAASAFRETVNWAGPIAAIHEVELSSWLNDFALLLWEVGDAKAARHPCRRSLRIGRRRLGAVHHLVATRHNNLALIEEQLGRFRFAELHYRLALQIRTELFGPQGSPTTNTLANFGGMLRLLGRFEEAETLLRRAQAAAETRPESPLRLVQTLTALAALLMDTHRVAQAVPLLVRAEALCASLYPATHPTLAKVRARLASARSDLH